MRYIASGTMIIVLLFSVVVIAHAEPITINNPGFEASGLPDGTWTAQDDCGFPRSGGRLPISKPIPGWILGPDSSPCRGPAGTFNPSVGTYQDQTVIEGMHVAYSETPTISQVLDAVLTANITYTLHVDIGNQANGVSPGYIVELLAGGNIIADDENSQSPDSGTFETSTVTFPAMPGDPMLGEPLEIRLSLFGGPQSGVQIHFDNVRLDASPTKPRPVFDPTPWDFFMVSASGGQQVTNPPGGVETNANCLGTFRVTEVDPGSTSATELRYRIQCSETKGVTQAHIHLGKARLTGSAVAFLFPNGAPTASIDGVIRREASSSQGVLTDADLQGDLAGTTIADLVDIMHADGAYLNVHTEANPDGEVRGQIVPVVNIPGVVEEFYLANGSGSQVVTGAIDGVTTDAVCIASFRQSDLDRIKYKVRCSGISGVTQVTMHIGGPQDNGVLAAVLFPDGIPTGAVSGAIKRETANSKGTLTNANVVDTTVTDLIDTMREGNTYFTVLTKTHPDGEVRGQIVRMDMLGGGL